MSTPSKPNQLDWTAIHGRVSATVDALMRDRDSSRKALCESVGIDPTSMTKFLGADGARQLSAEAIGLLAAAADRTTDWIYYGREPEAAPQAAQAAPAGLDYIPHDRIDFWPKNPRKHFDEEAIAELADNMLDQARASGGTGMLQNIVVRPHPDQEGRFQIVSGERRWRAIDLNIDRMHLPADVPVLCMTRPVGDADALAIAIAENVERRDMTPLEEARAYRALQEMREAETGEPVSAGRVAEELGLNKRTVQLRLELIDKLSPETQEALEQGRITLAVGRVLTAADPDDQAEALGQLDKGWIDTADEVRDLIFGDLVPVEGIPDAVAAAYRAAGGEIVTDQDEAAFFKSRPLFERAFAEHLDALKHELEGEFKEVRIIPRNGLFSSYNWTLDPEHPDAVGIIHVAWNHEITLYRGMIPKQVAQKAERNTAAGVDAEAADPVTKGHLEHARRRKTLALQRALAADPEAAMRVVIAALLDSGFRATTIRGRDWSDPAIEIDPAIAGEVETLKAREARSGWAETPDGRFSAIGLGGLTGAELHAALANIVASTVHSPFWLGSMDQLYGDHEDVLELAAHLDLPGREAELGLAEGREGDLDGIRKIGLLSILLDLEGPESAFDHGKTSMKDLREAVARRTGRSDQTDVEAVPGYVLPAFRFATAEEGRRRCGHGNRAIDEADADANAADAAAAE